MRKPGNDHGLARRERTTAESNEPDLFTIDKNQLDSEWVGQPKLYGKYARMLADARRDHEKAKAERELAAAEFKQLVRRDPQKYGHDKVTEECLRELMTATKEYQQHVRAVINAEHAVEVLEGIVKALDTRKYALQDLVALDARNYFSRHLAVPEQSREKTRKRERDVAFLRRHKPTTIDPNI